MTLPTNGGVHQNQNSTNNGSDAKTQNIDLVKLRKTAAIFNACHLKNDQKMFSFGNYSEGLRPRAFIQVLG